MATIDELQAIAAQLAQPDGAAGRSIAKMMHETNIGMTRHGIQFLQIDNNTQQLLEVGHGNASHVSDLLTQYPRLRYTGMETSTCMHEEAKRINAPAITAGRAHFIHYDGEHLPKQMHGFDGIFAVNTIYFWPDAAGFLEKLGNLLNYQGRIAITVAEKSFMQQLPFTKYGFNLFTPEELIALANPVQLTHLSTSHALETVKSKVGELVERKYFTVIWQKI